MDILGRLISKIRESIHFKQRASREKLLKTIEKQVIEIKEKPSKVALGCSLGIGVNFFPTLGLGFILAFFLAVLFRANRVSAVTVSLITGPLIPLKYAFNLVIGGIVQLSNAGTANLMEFISSQYSLLLKVGHFHEKLLGALEIFGLTFMIGAVINAVIFGIVLHFIVFFIIKHRIKKLSK